MWNQQREAFVWSQQGTRLGFPRRDNGEGEVVREEEQGCGLIKMCILSGRFKISLENIKVQRLASPIRPKAPVGLVRCGKEARELGESDRRKNELAICIHFCLPSSPMLRQTEQLE